MKRALIATIVMALLAGALAWRIQAAIGKENQKKAALAAAVADRKPPVVRAAEARRRDLVDRMSVSGAVRPEAEVDVFAKLPGRLESVKVKVGDQVKAGQVLAVVEHREAAWQAKQASAAVSLARANLQLQQGNLDRTRVIQTAGNATTAQVAAAEAALAVAQAQLEQALAVDGLANTTVSNATITAPISGVVTRKSCSTGTQATTQVALFQIQDNATMKLEAGVDARLAARLKVGMPVEVEIDALGGARFPGQIATVNPSLDPITRRSAVEVALPNENRRLMANMFARAEIGVGALTGVLSVPASAVLEENGEARVLAVREGRVVVIKPTVLAADGEFVGVEGLSDAEVVVLEGQKQLAADAPVKAVVGSAD